MFGALQVGERPQPIFFEYPVVKNVETDTVLALVVVVRASGRLVWWRSTGKTPRKHER
jgi:hypothetical protein